MPAPSGPAPTVSPLPAPAHGTVGARDAIGVLGGLGPYAGLDLVRTLFDETDAHADQEHLPVALVSYPGRIPDRSTWIADASAPSPVPPMLAVLHALDAAGCAVVGVPCNTAHAPVLFDALRAGLAGTPMRLLHIVDAIVAAIEREMPTVRRVGVLATDSSVANRLHQIGLEASGREALVPDAAVQARVHASIFDATWGLKAHSAPPDPRARTVLLDAVAHLVAHGAEAVILGCTELPLAVPERVYAGVPLVNSTRALAQALILATHPEKLRTSAESIGVAV
ncbi:MAG TPA: amino acid racemase [Rubricoccaceae bacterium]